MTNEPMQDAAASVDGQNAETPLQDQIEALKGEIEQLRADALRERADLENQRKRLAREIEQARKFANERLLSELLPLFDSMEAGLAAAAQNDPLRAGLELTLRQLHRIAENNGLVEVAPAPGDSFESTLSAAGPCSASSARSSNRSIRQLPAKCSSRCLVSASLQAALTIRNR